LYVLYVSHIILYVRSGVIVSYYKDNKKKLNYQVIPVESLLCPYLESF